MLETILSYLWPATEQVSGVYDESDRATYLLKAQMTASEMFTEIESTLIHPGKSDKTLNQEIYQLGQTRYGIHKHWHKRIVRSGPNTLKPFHENPPDRIIEEDDMLIVDLGPVFESWEADFARTFVLGDDPHKKKIRDALEPIWKSIQTEFLQNHSMTGEQLYELAVRTAQADGWTWGSHMAGHLVGDFPHERIPRDKTTLYIVKGNHVPLNTRAKDGTKRHWILEIYLRDEKRQLFAFFEQLMTVG